MFHFLATTTKGIFFDGEVDEVIFPSLQGPLSISTGYTNVIEVLADAGVMKIKTSNGTRFAAIIHGIVKVVAGECFVVAEDINYGEDIDLDRAIASKEKQLELLKEKSDAYAIKVARIKLNKALARIDAKTLSSGGK